MGTKLGFDLKTLLSLLGKEVKDPAVQAVLERAGKVKVTSSHVVAKQADFEFALSLPEGKKKKVLSTLFVGQTSELPAGFERGLTREAQLARLPAPKLSWQIGKGAVPVETTDVDHDTWDIDGFEVSADYREGKVRAITVSLSEDALGGGSLHTNPLHFATKPHDAIEDATLTAMALLVAWAIEKHGLPAKHDNPVGKLFAKRGITPRRFLIDACGRAPTTLDVAPSLATFLSTYTDNIHHDHEGGRASTVAAIKQLLGLSTDDACSYSDDYLGTFEGVLESPFHVPDAWAAVDRIAPIIDARETDYAKTKFLTSPDVALYEQAARARDRVAVEPERKAAAAKVAIDGEALVGLIDMSLKDKAVKETLTRLGLPIGKRIDEQANPALGVSYMGTNFEIAGKKALGIENVQFYADGQESYIRGLGAKVKFAGFTGTLPDGVVLGMARADVVAKLGAPKETGDDYDLWQRKGRRIIARYADGKLSRLSFGRPVAY